MLIKIPDNTKIKEPIIYKEGKQHYLNLSNSLAEEIFQKISSEYFKDDFTTYLEYSNSKITFCMNDEEEILDKAWEIYKEQQSIDTTESDTFIITAEELWKKLGSFCCHECGTQLLSENPIADKDGNYYCDECADNVLDFCGLCGEQLQKTDMIIDEKYERYCKGCYSDKLEELNNSSK